MGSLRDLDDQLLLQILQLVDARTLALCSGASRALYCFCMHDELWRALTLQVSLPGYPAACSACFYLSRCT